MTFFLVAHPNAVAFLEVALNLVLGLNQYRGITLILQDVKIPIFVPPWCRSDSPLLTPRHDREKHWTSSEIQCSTSKQEKSRVLRTDEEILKDLLPELGFARRGVRIETAIRNAIDQFRST
jgi:hypothetical protein